VETYTVTAFWLRKRMGKVEEAEQFLREGLRANPNSYELLYELGRVYAENKNDPDRARNLWEAALRRWQKQESAKPEPDKFSFVEITSHLAKIEEQQRNYSQALEYMEMWKARSPSPAAVQKQIEALQEKLRAPEAASPGKGSGSS